MNAPRGFIGRVAGWLYTLWCGTLRYAEVGRDGPERLSDQGELLVFVSWHGEIFAFPFKRKTWRLFAIVSRSRDGEYLAGILASQGIVSLRGSSSRGGVAALVRGAKMMRDRKMHAYITVDGPRGPRHEVKDGAFLLAHRAGAYLVPLRAVHEKAKIFRSWDGFSLPYPFSRVRLVFGEPYRIEARELTDEGICRERKRLKEKLESMAPAEPR